jgi:16S rRNA (guanine966-N2)-methyltransferase
MRVISGKYRGRRLKGPEGLELRPTGDRLKESLFNILGRDISGAIMLDVFSGTGAIGIEGLSRGAREAVFIENAATGQRLIRKNLELCGIHIGYRILQQDAFTALRFLARQGFKANIVFFDPPYDWKPYSDLLEIVFKKELLMQPSRVVIEHHRKAALPESGDGYRRSRLAGQGDHCLSFYEELTEASLS